MHRTAHVLLAASAVGASLIAADAVAGPVHARAAVDPRIDLFRDARNMTDPFFSRLSGEVPVIVTFTRKPTALDLEAIQAEGARIARDTSGRPLGRGKRVTARLDAAAAARVAALPFVRSVDFDGPPVPMPRPLDLTANLISADATWRSHFEGGSALTGAGVTICDVDNGTDILHPLFFRADGGFFEWIDTNKSGRLEPDVDQIDLGNGPVTIRASNGIVWDRRTGEPLWGTDAAAYDPTYDWLYADENGDGRRNVGAAEGFTESTPGYGERIFVRDDIDESGALEAGEKLVALGTSKIRAFRVGQDVYRRGENLINAPFDTEMLHGVGSSGVMVAGQPGYSKLVGMAPDADLIMATDGQGQSQTQMTTFCIQEGARVVLHEYAPWIGYHLDGSSPLEELIDDSNAEGVVHVNPAGNLSTSKKLYKKTVTLGSVTDIPIEIPAIGESYMVFTLLWRDTSRDLRLTLNRPGGASVTLPLDSASGFQQAFDDELEIAGYREDSERGTAMVMFYLYPQNGPPAVLPEGTWSLEVNDLSPPGPGQLTLFGYVYDEISGWAQGIHFPQDSSEDHLIGWPGTADHGMAIAAFTGHPFNDATTGQRAYYSGRGRRIDDEPIMWISAPDNPVVPARFEGDGISYMIYGGTSGASPHVAGASALIVQADPTLTGDGVKEKIRAGAVTDAFTGVVPNQDYGHGKLDVYRSIFGQAPPAGGPPEVANQAFVVAPGASDIAVVATDPDGEPLVLEVDREYDGVWDETLSGAALPVDFEELGEYTLKVRATDPTGRTDQALLRVTVQPSVDEEPRDDDDKIEPGFYPEGGACTVRGAGTSDSSRGAGSGSGALLALAVAGALAARRRRA